MSMLNSTNAEIQYNAICYLYDNMKTNQPAIDYDTLKGTREYDSTMLIYRKVLPMVNSKNSWVAAPLFVTQASLSITGLNLCGIC
jgi:hypothetical protein